MEMEIIKKVFPAEGAGGMKAQRQESKEHVCSGNKGNPDWIEHGGVYVRQVLEKEEHCGKSSVLCVSREEGE